MRLTYSLLIELFKIAFQHGVAKTYGPAIKKET